VTKRELELLQPWLQAGVGAPVAATDVLQDVLARKGYITAVEGGYALTERGAEHAAKIPTRIPPALMVGRPSMPVDSPEGDEGEA
jgi:hypothetical protein